MRLPSQQRRRGPRGTTLPSSLRHGALLLAVVGTLAVGSQLARPAHVNAVAPRPSAALATSLDGRLPDGAPAVASEGFTRTLFALTVETPAPTTSVTTLSTTPRAAAPTAAPLVATAAVPVQRDVVVAPLSRITATPAPEPVVRAAVIAPASSRYATIGEMNNVALAQTPWPAEL